MDFKGMEKTKDVIIHNCVICKQPVDDIYRDGILVQRGIHTECANRQLEEFELREKREIRRC